MKALYESLTSEITREFFEEYGNIRNSYLKFKNNKNPDLDDVRSGLACLKKKKSKMVIVWKKEEKLSRRVQRMTFLINMTIPLTLNHWNSMHLRSRVFNVTPLNEDEQIIYEVEKS